MQTLTQTWLADNPGRIASYYATGYQNLAEFSQNQDWNRVRKFEQYYDEAKNEDEDKLVLTENAKRDLLVAKHKLLEFAASLIGDRPINYLEFGVRAGVSMEVVASAHLHQDSRLYGFDTFEGLPEDWVSFWGNKKSRMFGQGAMAVEQMPVFQDQRIKLFKGVFQETLPNALNTIKKDKISFLNIDCDIYTGALYALTMCHPYLNSGSFVYFDEFYDPLNEFAAFNDYIRSYYLKGKFTLIGRAYDGYLFRYEE
jgi:hypothetical protein